MLQHTAKRLLRLTGDSVRLKLKRLGKKGAQIARILSVDVDVARFFVYFCERHFEVISRHAFQFLVPGSVV